jgi:hypothetical protein
VAIAASGVVNFDFVIALTELLPGRLEAKVETVYVSLIGAEASDPRITCVLEHSGESSARRRDGATVQITAAPRRAPISAAKAEGEFGGPPSSLRLAFWGRSPAARWRLYIEPEVITRSNVDLSGLSKIQIGIACAGFGSYSRRFSSCSGTTAATATDKGATVNHALDPPFRADAVDPPRGLTPSTTSADPRFQPGLGALRCRVGT